MLARSARVKWLKKMKNANGIEFFSSWNASGDTGAHVARKSIKAVNQKNGVKYNFSEIALRIRIIFNLIIAH